MKNISLIRHNKIYLSIILFVPILMLTMACNNADDNVLSGIAEQTNKAEISFYDINQPDPTSAISYIEVTDPEEIKKLANIVSNYVSPEYKCGYGGTLIFKKDNNILVLMEFNLDPDCQHIVYFLEGQQYSKKINKKGIKLLKSFKEQK